MKLQLLSEDDWAAWRDLRLAALREAPYAFCSTLADWQDAEESRWRMRLTDVPYNLIAELDGRPAGMVSGVAPDGNGTAELISLWVAPFARGRGVGDALLEAVHCWAVETGATRLALQVFDGNATAKALYRRHGFAGENGHLVRSLLANNA